jgi:FkbM family methyltransferase
MKRIITNFFNLKESLIYYEYRYLKLKKKFKFFDNLNLNQNSIVLDLGSNVGDVTKYIYKKYNSFIYGYEPNVHAYNLQKKRFNNIEKIKIYNECIDIEDGERKIYFHKNSKDKGDIEHSHASSLDIDKANISPDNFQIAKSRSIKSILDKFNKIDLIKIDIEGNEYKILPEIMKIKIRSTPKAI